MNWKFYVLAAVKDGHCTSSFGGLMVKAYMLADLHNRSKIAQKFPELARQFEKAWEDHEKYIRENQ